MGTYRITVDGAEFIVEVGDLRHRPTIVRVNGQEMIVDWGQLPGEAGAASRPATPVVSTAEAPTPPAASLPLGPARSQEADAGKAVTAPMPGKVLAVRVQAGDSVAFGQELCVLEAMKMEQHIRAPRDGVIATVDVTPGEIVMHGQVLFTYR